jgi:hypothetical protein
MAFLGEFFMVYDIHMHQLNLGEFKILKFLDEIRFKKCVILHLFGNVRIIIFIFRKKPVPYQRGGGFINGNCIILSILFFLLMLRES